MGKKTNYCLSFSFVFPNNMDPNRYFSGYNLKNAGRKQKFGYAKNVQFGREIFTLSHVAYITVDFKKLVSDLFHAGSALVKANVPREKRGHQNDPET